MGSGKGEGARPEERTKTGSFDTQVRQKVGKGGAQIADLVEGPNIKGKVEQEIKLQVENAGHEAADPLTGQRIPRDYRDHAKTYFDSFLQRKPADVE